MSDAHDRTERPTPRRLERARLEGRLPHSSLAAAAAVAVLVAIPALAGMKAAGDWFALLRATAQDARVPTDAPGAALKTWNSWHSGWVVIGAAGATALIAAVAAAAMTGSLGFSPLALRPRLARLSLRAGIAQLVGWQGLFQSATAAAAVVLVSWSAWPAARALLTMASSGLSPAGSAAVLGEALSALWLRLSFALALLGAVEIWWSRWRAVASLLMTPREIKEERADVEGRPETRARRRAYAARKARDVQVASIRKASAVVVNPTHVAVALRYAPPAIDVPIVVARGADFAAIVVRTVAALHDVPIVESPDLARDLYTRINVGQAIPENCFAAVAAVFAWLIRTRGSLAGGEPDG